MVIGIKMKDFGFVLKDKSESLRFVLVHTGPNRLKLVWTGLKSVLNGSEWVWMRFGTSMHCSKINTMITKEHDLSIKSARCRVHKIWLARFHITIEWGRSRARGRCRSSQIGSSTWQNSGSFCELKFLVNISETLLADSQGHREFLTEKSYLSGHLVLETMFEDICRSQTLTTSGQ